MEENKKHNQSTDNQQNGAMDQNNEPIIDLNADENLAGTTHLNDELTNDNEHEKLQNDLNELKDKYLRLAAEFDNFKRRTARETMDLRLTANKELMVSLLDVLDDLERAEKQIESATDVNSVKEGLGLVFNKMKNTLHSKGLKSFESKNQEFDVELHEAITEIPAPTDDLKGKVLDEVQKGYYLNDKIIRYAKVVVGK
jgi:molecular chaperone GrpE